MALAINTNIASLVAQQNLRSANTQLKVSVQRLSSGFRVNSAADDAAGLARANQLKSQARCIQAAMRNVNDGFSALEVADKAADRITSLVGRMGELAASAAQGTLDSGTRGYYNDEYNQLILEIDRIANTTEFGGHKLLNGSEVALTMQVGFKNSSSDQLTVSMKALLATGTDPLAAIAHEMQSANTVAGPSDTVLLAGGWFNFTVGGTPYSYSTPDSVTLNEFVTGLNGAFGGAITASAIDTGSGWVFKLASDTPGTAGEIAITMNQTVFTMNTTQAPHDAVPGTGGFGLSSDALASVSGALGVVAALSAALKSVSDARAIYGASANRLTAALSNLQVTFTNYQAAESRIRDADFAFETAQYSRNQIMVQAGVSVLAQANTLPQNALALLR